MVLHNVAFLAPIPIYQVEGIVMNTRSARLADRLEAHAQALSEFAEGLSLVEWRTPVPGDGRTIGVTVHHVASMYPLEIQLAQGIASGAPMTGVTWQAVHDINAGHAKEYRDVTKEAASALVKQNSAAAAKAIRAMTDDELDTAVTQSLYGDAVLTCQFFLEDHAIRHSMHHLARMRAALRTEVAA
jgi:hypothetical protein